MSTLRRVARNLLLAALSHRQRFLKFGAVGLLGAAFNTVLLTLLVEGVHLPTLACVAVATEATILLNFTINDQWTFRRAPRSHPMWRRAAHYNSVAFGGLILSLAVVAALTTLTALHYAVANAFAIMAAASWNYTGSVRFAWRHESKPLSPPQFVLRASDEALTEEIGA